MTAELPLLESGLSADCLVLGLWAPVLITMDSRISPKGWYVDLLDLRGSIEKLQDGAERKSDKFGAIRHPRNNAMGFESSRAHHA